MSNEADHHERQPLLNGSPFRGSNEPVLRDVSTSLVRGLSARQVQTIAIGGTIGTGLFLGTGRSLSIGGPGTMLVCYGVTGFIVYVTLLLLGEMATQYPVAGSFNVYATRFVDPAYGFALSWNYWLNDAVSVAADLTAAQILLAFWNLDIEPWVVSATMLIFLLCVNAIDVKAYGELEYWLSSVKIVTILVFILVGTAVNGGLNEARRPIGFTNWTIGDAPFVGGFGGFATVFVTAALSYGGTESLGITAGETKDPARNMPRVVKYVFFRILLFYLFTVIIIGLNVPYTYPNLSNRSVTTSPFTIVFSLAGSRIAASAMNAVLLTSVLSAGNHALFAGTRILHSLAVSKDVNSETTAACAPGYAQAPAFLGWTTRRGVPYFALLATCSVSALCFGTSFIGRGQLWIWLQNLVGVSNQIAWLSIGLTSWRFRKAWAQQGRSLDDLLFHASWTRGWGPPFVVISVVVIMIGQMYPLIYPTPIFIDIVSLYLQIPLFLVCFISWKVLAQTKTVRLDMVDLSIDEYVLDEETAEQMEAEEAQRQERLKGLGSWKWRLYYWLA